MARLCLTVSAGACCSQSQRGTLDVQEQKVRGDDRSCLHGFGAGLGRGEEVEDHACHLVIRLV